MYIYIYILYIYIYETTFLTQQRSSPLSDFGLDNWPLRTNPESSATRSPWGNPKIHLSIIINYDSSWVCKELEVFSEFVCMNCEHLSLT